MAKGNDLSCLTVTRYADDKIYVLNSFYGKEAEQLYKKLARVKKIRIKDALKKKHIKTIFSKLKTRGNK